MLGAQREIIPLEPLLLALHDDNNDVRQAAQEAFVKQGEHLPTEKLVELLQHEDWTIRATALDALGELGERAPLDPLLSALHDKKASVRGRAVWALVKLEDRVPIEPLLAVLQDNGDGDDDPNAFFPSSFYARHMAADALASQGKRIPSEFLVDRLLNGVGYERIMAAKALADHSDESVINPLAYAALHDGFDHVQRLAVEALAKQGKAVPIEFFIRLLHNDNINIQRAVVEALGQREEEASLEPLLALLQGPDLPILGPSILTTLGERIPRETLLYLLNYAIPEIRQIIGSILEKSQEEVPLGDILTALHNEEERLTAIKILEKQEETDFFELLMLLIYDKN